VSCIVPPDADAIHESARMVRLRLPVHDPYLAMAMTADLITLAEAYLAEHPDAGMTKIDERYGEPTLPMRGHLLGLKTLKCVLCGEANSRVNAHPHIECKPKEAKP